MTSHWPGTETGTLKGVLFKHWPSAGPAIYTGHARNATHAVLRASRDSGEGDVVKSESIP